MLDMPSPGRFQNIGWLKAVRNKKIEFFFIAQYDRAFQDELNEPFPAFLR